MIAFKCDIRVSMALQWYHTCNVATPSSVYDICIPGPDMMIRSSGPFHVTVGLGLPQTRHVNVAVSFTLNTTSDMGTLNDGADSKLNSEE